MILSLSPPTRPRNVVSYEEPVLQSQQLPGAGETKAAVPHSDFREPALGRHVLLDRLVGRCAPRRGGDIETSASASVDSTLSCYLWSFEPPEKSLVHVECNLDGYSYRCSDYLWYRIISFNWVLVTDGIEIEKGLGFAANLPTKLGIWEDILHMYYVYNIFV